MENKHIYGNTLNVERIVSYFQDIWNASSLLTNLLTTRELTISFSTHVSILWELGAFTNVSAGSIGNVQRVITLAPNDNRANNATETTESLKIPTRNYNYCTVITDILCKIFACRAKISDTKIIVHRCTHYL